MKKKVVAIVAMVMVALMILGNSTYTVSEKHHVHTQNKGYVMEVTETEKTRLGETVKITKYYYDIFNTEMEEEPYGSYVVYEK